MTRLLMPIILIGTAIAIFFLLTNPIYNDLSALRVQVSSYNDALDNSKALENQRDVLTSKYNTINPDYLMKLKKLLPDNVDNIRLILEIEQMASPYGMILKNIKYNATDPKATVTTQLGGAAKIAPKNYGIFDLEFATSGTYSNFINFTKGLESNLRIVDISSIAFSSDLNNPNSRNFSPFEVYNYIFKIKTYWLKN